MIEFYTAFPPTVNSYYVKTRNGIFIGKKGKKFREQVALDIKEQLGGINTLADSLAVTVILAPPDNRTRDLDNYMKSLLDAITHSGLWEDDSLIDQLAIYRAKPIVEIKAKAKKAIAGGAVYVRIEESGPVLALASLVTVI